MNHLLNDIILVYPTATLDQYGRKTYGTPAVVMGRIVEKTEELHDPQGESITSDAAVHLPASTAIEVGAKVKHDQTYYKALRVNKPKTHAQIHHVKAYLQYAKN